MKKTTILAALALCALPVMAQSQNVSLLYTQLSSRDFTVGGTSFSADKSKGFALRYGIDIAKFSKLGDARLAFEGTWMPRTSGSTIKVNNVPVPSGSETVEYRHEYLGLGLSMNWTKVVDFGAALELRHEGNALSIKQAGNHMEMGNDFTRPWLSLHVGYTFPVPTVKPFVSLEFNLPLAKKETATVTALEFELGRNLNPKSQLSLNAGVRF